MSEDQQPETEQRGAEGVIIAITFVAVLVYVASPGICLALIDDVPSFLEPVFTPLEWLYDNCGAYEAFIDACN